MSENVTVQTIKYDYLIALDSFKGSMTSPEAGSAVKKGLEARNTDARVKVIPVADGGEGTVEALSYGKNVETRVVDVTGPLGESVEATYTVIDGTTAIMEMSQAAGITLVPAEKRNPLVTTTYGVGEMIVHALENGCDHIIMGIGGSATNDCGIGMLQALGFDVVDNASKNVCFGANALLEAAHINDAGVNDRIKKCKYTIACDVDNPLTGELGCSRIFAPQKGATASMVEDMDKWMEHFVEVVQQDYGHLPGQNDSQLHLTPGAGAAGGLGYAFLRFLGGELKSGADIVIEQLGLNDIIRESSVVVVGEGKLDEQTTMGKIPGTIAKVAKSLGKKVIAVAGMVQDREILENTGLFDEIVEIDRGDMTLDEAMVKENAMGNLERTVGRML